MPSSIPNSRRGFTLIELFVCSAVTFIAGLLAYRVFFVRAKPCYLVSSGASHQKQIALAFLQYAQDYDARFPPAVSYITVAPGAADSTKSRTQFAQSWGPDRILPDGRVVPGLLSPYTKSNQLFVDPQGAKFPNRVLEYMYNDLLVRQKQTDVVDGSRTVLTIDAEDRLANAGHAYTPNTGPYPAVFNDTGGCDAGQGASIRTARGRHKNGTNAAFVDGHIQGFASGANDPIFFPPRDSSSAGSIDPATQQRIGPDPGDAMEFGGRFYTATFHTR